MREISQNRDSNLELYRIIVMMMIVAHHYVVCSGLMSPMRQHPISIPTFFYMWFGMWGKTGINCFILITGYFMCTSQITLKKFLKLYFQVVFYALSIYAIFAVVGREPLSIIIIIQKLFPFKHIISDNFTEAFFVWWLFIPFLTALVRNITRKQHLWLITLCVTVFSLYDKMPFTEIAVNPVVWFSTLFFIASYIRFYPQHVYKHNNAKVWGLLMSGGVILAMLSVASILCIDFYWGKEKSIFFLVAGENAPFALIVAVTSFMFFKNLSLRYNPLINAIAATTFGVLLIHSNSPAMRNWLWKDVVDAVGHYNSHLYWLYAIISVIVIFICCSLIDQLRIKYIEKYLMQWMEQKVSTTRMKKLRWKHYE